MNAAHSGAIPPVVNTRGTNEAFSHSLNLSLRILSFSRSRSYDRVEPNEFELSLTRDAQGLGPRLD